MEKRNCTARISKNYDTIWECVIPYINNSEDRNSVSLVCKKWYEIDAITRKHVKMTSCYAAKPETLSKRFPHLQSFKLKGKPRPANFNLIPEDWGGYLTPWALEIAKCFSQMKALHFRRMIVGDSDLQLLACSLGSVLQVFKLDKCSGFSTDGILHICRSCRRLKTLFLEECSIIEKDGEWIHELALNNRVLENLNFHMTDLIKVRVEDLEMIARNCAASLISMKVSDSFDIADLIGFFRTAVALEEFGGGSYFEQSTTQPVAGDCNEKLGRYCELLFPPRLCRLGLAYFGTDQLPIVSTIVSRLKELDLQYAFLDTAAHCVLLQSCPNLEILQTREVIGDNGLEVLSQFCKRLKKIRVERGDDGQEMEDAEGAITHRGLIALAQGCLELEYIAVYVTDIANVALEIIGTNLKKLHDFRIALLDRIETITDFPLDNGVRTLLRGCHKLRRFVFYVRPGGLTDVGLSYIGKYSPNIAWMLLGFVGESDQGLLEFAKGCPSLRKIEIRGCNFSEHAFALAVLQLKSLKQLWVQGYNESPTGLDILFMARPFWNIELIPTRQQVINVNENGENVVAVHRSQFLAYYSLAGKRTDAPDTVRILHPFN